MDPVTTTLPTPAVVGRYELVAELATGGMGAVYLARLRGPAGFGRTVAIKRLHPHLAKQAAFRNAFVDEARLASRVTHANVVQTLDVVDVEGELYLVMEFVLGEPLSVVWRHARDAGRAIPRAVAIGIASQVLQGLHAAHEAVDEQGKALGIIHRDVSPQNVLVGADGIARIIDFGVAKANDRLQTTEDGIVKGKFAYMAPEQLTGASTDRRVDVYAASVLLWELLANERLFETTDRGQIVFLSANGALRRPSAVVPDLPEDLEDVVMKGLARNPTDRWATALEMATALERAHRAATSMELGAWLASEQTSLDDRRRLLAEIESRPSAWTGVDPAPRSRRWPWVAGAAALAIVAAGALAYRTYGGSPGTPPAPSAGVLATSSTTTWPPADAGGLADSKPASSDSAAAALSASPPRPATATTARPNVPVSTGGRPHATTTTKPHPTNTGDSLFPRN